MPPRFSPRGLVTPPEAFWNDEVEGAWVEPRSSEEAEQLLVAYYLSQVSRNVVAVLREIGWTRGDLADAIGKPNHNRLSVSRLGDSARSLTSRDRVGAIGARSRTPANLGSPISWAVRTKRRGSPELWRVHRRASDRWDDTTSAKTC